MRLAWKPLPAVGMDAAPSRRHRQVVAISSGTFLRAVIAVALVWAWLRLWQWVMIAFIAVALAVAVEPAIRWLDRRGLRRSYTAPLLILGGTGILLAFLVLSAASLRDDARVIEARSTEFYGSVVGSLPPALQEAVRSFAPRSDMFVEVGRTFLGGAAGLAVVLVLAVYFLLDGRRTYDWLVACAPARSRDKVHETAEGASAAIAAFARGNLITSALSAVATWVVLLALHVPAALLLGVLAGVCDLLPVIGIFLSAGPAILLALTVSPTAAVAVAAFFVVYNVVENYYIQPKVYGKAMALSDLAVIGAFLVGAELGGVLGALVALPLAATYPVVERVWFRGTARRDLPRAHERIEAQPEH
jgi:predicted PurR-regulated permease PerM